MSVISDFFVGTVEEITIAYPELRPKDQMPAVGLDTDFEALAESAPEPTIEQEDAAETVKSRLPALYWKGMSSLALALLRRVLVAQQDERMPESILMSVDYSAGVERLLPDLVDAASLLEDTELESASSRWVQQLAEAQLRPSEAMEFLSAFRQLCRIAKSRNLSVFLFSTS